MNPSYNPKVAISHCHSYDLTELQPAMARALDLAELPDLQNKKILLKPNLLSGSDPAKAITTHPQFLQAVIRELKNRGAFTIAVGDSCAVGNSIHAAEKAGMLSVCRDEKVEWLDFQETKVMPLTEGKIQKQFYPAAVVQDYDMLISLPKMKTHAMMYYTGAMKNLFGVFPGLAKAQFHFRLPDQRDFAAMIVDLNLALKPQFAILDGIVAMEGAGPGNGDPRPMGLVMASANVLALDISASRIMGYKPLDLPIHRDAMERGIWLDSEDQIKIVGEELEVVKNYKRIHVVQDTGMLKQHVSPGIYRFITNLMVPRPHFRHKRCILCGKCVKICPPKALTIEGNRKKKVRIDYNKCIRCFCCDEVCPEKAIRISRM